MEKQLFIGREPKPGLLIPAKNSKDGFCKPVGGLWTSTLNQRGTSGWVEWCISEQFSEPRRGWILTSHENARICTINNLPDLIRLHNKYPLVNELTLKHNFFKYLDFEAISIDYDAIHLTEEGQWATRFSDPLNLYGWDCESTLWFRWVFQKVEGPINLGRCDDGKSE